MEWWVAVLVMYLDVISGLIVASGFLLLLVAGIYWIIFAVKWDEVYWKNSTKDVDARSKMMMVPIKKTKLLVPLCLFMWLLASLIPSPQTLFKIVALKYGTDAAFSQEAKNLGNKIYESMDKSLSLLNKKLDEYNKSAKENK